MVKIKSDKIIKVSVLGVTAGGGEPYEGSYEVTPSQEEQILHTKKKQLLENVVVHPIPSNYGLITYNGYELLIT